MTSRFLIAYGTAEGQTRRIAYRIAEKLQPHGRVDVYDITHLPPDLHIELDGYTAVMLAASVHQGHHSRAAVQFVLGNRDLLNRIPSALVSVSLHAAGDEEERNEARIYVDDFLSETGWRPAAVHLAAGAIRFSHYDFFKRWIMKAIARDRGLSVEPGRDHEFTDWAALDTFAGEFAATRATPGAGTVAHGRAARHPS